MSCQVKISQAQRIPRQQGHDGAFSADGMGETCQQFMRLWPQKKTGNLKNSWGTLLTTFSFATAICPKNRDGNLHRSFHTSLQPAGQLQGNPFQLPITALVFVGTGLKKKSNNFKVPILSCDAKRRCSIFCRALVFIVGPWLNQKSDNFKVPFCSC